MQSLSEKLKLATALAHSSLETTAFSLALREGKLPRESSVTYLVGLSIIHAVLERSFSLNGFTPNREIFRITAPKLSFLLADLALISAERVKTIKPAVMNAIELVNQLIVASSSDAAPIGFLYVLEASQNDGLFLKEAFADSLGLPKEKISYFDCYGAKTRSNWEQFLNRLDSQPLTDEEAKVVETSAIAAYAGLEKLQCSLLPFSREALTHNVTAVNPEAGIHAMPEDPVLIDVALRAGIRARDKFPYLEQRFGERGRRFTASDSCWLLSLVPQEFNSIKKSIWWLRTVLSSRGIPSVILENHMRELASGLEAVPNCGGTTENFRKAIVALEAERGKYLSEADYQKISAKYRDDLNSNSGNLDPLPLLISARLDELSGIKGADEATYGWFASSQGKAAKWGTLISEVSRQLEKL
jgi:heme oxygenase